MPAVSVCIPVYKGERHIAETVRSVLRQTFSDFELVVLDNANTDRTAEIVQAIPDSRIRLEHNDSVLPVADNWNRAVRLSRSPLVKLLCADDLLYPTCLQRQVAAMREQENIALVASRHDFLNADGRVVLPRRGLGGLLGYRTGRDAIRRVVRHGANPIGDPGDVLFRREHFDATTGFDENRVFVMELDLWTRLLAHGDFLGLPDTLSAFRLAGDTISGAADRADYLTQRATTRELARVWNVPTVDVLVSGMGAPLSRARRVLALALAQASTRSRQQPTRAHGPARVDTKI
jgi:glycosyltransferase involved in cell wall biosynthesis